MRGLTGRPDGRHAYVCLDGDCLHQISSKALSRSFKAPQSGLNGKTFVPRVHELAERRLLETIGLARRSGTLATGTEAVLQGPPEANACAVILAASDLAERTERQAKRMCAETFLGSERLGKAAGMGRVGIMKFEPGRLADRAAYWLRVWRATA